MDKAKGLGNSKRAFSNWMHNKFVLNFPNGNSISTIWGTGTYSDNHDVGLLDGNDFMKSMETFMESNTVEVMIDCSARLSRRLSNKFSGDPNASVIGYLSMENWLYVVNAVAHEKTPAVDSGESEANEQNQ